MMDVGFGLRFLSHGGCLCIVGVGLPRVLVGRW